MARRVGYPLRPLKSGRWQVLVLDPASRTQIGMGTYADKREAERAGQRHAASVSSGTCFDPRRGEVTVESYLTTWLQARRTTGRHGERYSIEATRMADRYICAALGNVLLVDLTPAKVRRWYDELVAAQVARFGRAGLVPPKSYRVPHAGLADAVGRADRQEPGHGTLSRGGTVT